LATARSSASSSCVASASGSSNINASLCFCSISPAFIVLHPGRFCCETGAVSEFGAGGFHATRCDRSDATCREGLQLDIKNRSVISGLSVTSIGHAVPHGISCCLSPLPNRRIMLVGGRIAAFAGVSRCRLTIVVWKLIAGFPEGATCHVAARRPTRDASIMADERLVRTAASTCGEACKRWHRLRLDRATAVMTTEHTRGLARASHVEGGTSSPCHCNSIYSRRRPTKEE
jgi:hypothetical protein